MLKSLFKPRPAVAAGQALYASAVGQARTPSLYSEMGAPDSVMGRFELYTLHVLLLVRRLKNEGVQAVETSQALFDSYLSGLDIALREIGVGDLSVGKKMKKLGRAFYGRVTAYEAALDTSDRAALSALIDRTIFEGKGAPDRLADYVMARDKVLAANALQSLLAGQVDWQGDEA